MKLSAGVPCFPALQTLRSHWPSAAVRRQCPCPGTGQPEGPIESDRSDYNSDVLSKSSPFRLFYTWQIYGSSVWEISVLTLCSRAASIKMVPTPHIGSTTQEPGWGTGDSIQYSTDCQVIDNKHHAKSLKMRTAWRLNGHIQWRLNLPCFFLGDW